MRKVFTNRNSQEMIITDEGIHYTEREKSTIIPRDQITKPLKFTRFSRTLSIYTTWGTAYTYLVADDDEKFRLEEALETFNALIGRPVGRKLCDKDFNLKEVSQESFEGFNLDSFKGFKTSIPDSKEFRMRCNVCGHIYCYTMGEYRENERLKGQIDTKELSGAITSVFTSRYLGSSERQEAEMMKMRVKDFSRCPKCNSGNIQKISENESTAALENNAAPAVSPMDELKKLKELLDLGIVTQEEFEAKKKQLLGL